MELVTFWFFLLGVILGVLAGYTAHKKKIDIQKAIENKLMEKFGKK